MPEYKSKTELLTAMQTGFDAFERLLDSLSDEQMTTPQVNGAWSVKDNITHLSTWQSYALEAIQTARQGRAFVHPWHNLSEDEANEQIYQQHKDRSLADVRNEFRSTFQLLRDGVLMMSDEELNRPYINENDRLPWQTVAGNSYDHYQEHSEIIQRWLAQQHTATEQ